MSSLLGRLGNLFPLVVVRLGGSGGEARTVSVCQDDSEGGVEDLRGSAVLPGSVFRFRPTVGPSSGRADS